MAEELRVPEDLEAPWLTREYIVENGWYRVHRNSMETTPPGAQYKETREFSDIPWDSKDLTPGDIIIFDEYENLEDRFLKVTEELIKEMKCGGRDSYPVGIIVPSPSNLTSDKVICR